MGSIRADVALGVNKTITQIEIRIRSRLLRAEAMFSDNYMLNDDLLGHFREANLTNLVYLIWMQAYFARGLCLVG